MTIEAMKNIAPTDNLYKFLALFGLALLCIGVFLQWDRYDSYSKARATLDVTIDEQLPLHSEELLRLNESVRASIREFITSGLRPGSATPFSEGTLTNQELLDHLRQLDATGEAVARSEQMAHVAYDAYKRIVTISSILCTIGGAVSLSGFSLWYLLLQRTENTKSRLERVKAERELAALATDSADASNGDSCTTAS